jgi:hypothetical protein
VTVDLDELERLAKAATHSEWRMVWPVMDQNREDGEPVPVYGVVGPSDSTEMVGAVPIGYEEDSRFIAAANPKVVLKLVADLRRARNDVAVYREDLAALESKLGAMSANRPNASTLTVAIRELKERRNNYAARRDSFAREGAYAEVVASYDATLAEIDGAIAVLERLRSA